jgi:hypothetical protein
MEVPIRLHLRREVGTEDAVPIAQQILRSGVPGKCFAELLARYILT